MLKITAKIYVMVILKYNEHKFLDIIYIEIKYQSLKNKKMWKFMNFKTFLKFFKTSNLKIVE